MTTSPQTTTLYRPVGRQELQLVVESEWRRFPPRLYWQPIFYPVLTAEYAAQIAREWNTKDAASGYAGYALAFEVRTDFLQTYEVQEVGGRDCREYWIPAEELEAFNNAIVGKIRVMEEFYPPATGS